MCPSMQTAGTEMRDAAGEREACWACGRAGATAYRGPTALRVEMEMADRAMVRHAAVLRRWIALAVAGVIAMVVGYVTGVEWVTTLGLSAYFGGGLLSFGWYTYGYGGSRALRRRYEHLAVTHADGLARRAGLDE